jgi:hypothetical protein
MTTPPETPHETQPTDSRPPSPAEGASMREEPSVWRFALWSSVSLAVVITLGVLVARLLHELGLD